MNGKPIANPKADMPTTKFNLPLGAVAILPNKVPRIGPVHEKETTTSVNAMKKIPTKPPRLDAESTLLASVCGKAIS